MDLYYNFVDQKIYIFKKLEKIKVDFKFTSKRAWKLDLHLESTLES